ncbi:MAG: ATP-binding protein [Chitinispirillaceae bacterium]|nr:ATP-binding protein [Chitinispirillaceae bacterium]
MNISKSELISVVRMYNPWWMESRFPDLPLWKRAAFKEITEWIESPPIGRALLLTGARQVGKTTLFLQTINHLLDKGVSPANIIYVTFDHPLLRLIGIEDTIKIWKEIEPHNEKIEYLFLDEIQSIRDWQIWVKHQVDFNKNRRIAITGSSTSLHTENIESGVGRWYTLKIATLSFFEYLKIKKLKIPKLPKVTSLAQLFEWEEHKFENVASYAEPLVGFFNEYLLQGGFPQCALTNSITLSHKILREDIVDKVLKRDMTALFGVRRIVELEQTFLYLCLHDGGLLDVENLCRDLQLKKPTVLNFINLLETTHLIYRLLPYGYGKEVLRGRPKIYLADPAIAPAVLLKGKTLLQDDTALGKAVETTFFKHLFTRYYRQNIAFSYWKGKNENEVDIVAEIEGTIVPFEVKYRSDTTSKQYFKGLRQLCKEKSINRCYIITRNINDFGPLFIEELKPTKLMRIPAALACYWLGEAEFILGMRDYINGEE